jgi:hypothetical protein
MTCTYLLEVIMGIQLRTIFPAIVGLSVAAVLTAGTPAWADAAAPKGVPGGFADGLSAVASVSASDAWAVGIWHDRTGNEQTLIEHWNGSRWQITGSPDPAGRKADNELDAVAARSQSSAWAVGQFWNGANWQPQTEHWNGEAWRVVKTPDPGGHAARDGLTAVTATSPSSAWAVGAYTTGSTERALILHWNGKSWRQAASPNPGGTDGSALTAITAVSPDSIWAAGEYWTATTEKTMILHWNGRTWRQVASPNAGGTSGNGGLASIASGSESTGWATGSYVTPSSVQQTLTERWNGHRWLIAASPDPGGPSQASTLVAIASAGPRAWAVGYTSPGHTSFPLALRWNGTSWKTSPVPLPAGTTGGGLWGAGPAPRGKAWAVGEFFTGHASLSLIEQWTGKAWKRVPSPNR